MAHGNFKPRNKHLNDLLMSKKGGAHEAKAGRLAKRAKLNRETERALRDEME